LSDHIPRRCSAFRAFGLWEGREFAEIERTDAVRFQLWMRAYEVEAPPGGQTAAQLRARVTDWLEERQKTAATILAVTHAGVTRMARAVAAGKSRRHRRGGSPSQTIDLTRTDRT